MKKYNCLSTLCTCFLAGAALVFPIDACYAKSISKDNTNIRSGPSTKESILFSVPQGYPIKIQKKTGDWSYFRDWQDNTGWVSNPLVSDINTAVVLADKANVRSSASVRSPVVLNVAMGEIYRVLKKKDNWVELGYYDSNTPIGWIRDDLVFGE